VAQPSPAFDDAWTILVVDDNRELTVTGIKFKPSTSTISTVIDTTISRTTSVGKGGSWTTKIDISGLDDSEHLLQVTGTAEGGGAYEQTFTIPAEGQSTDEGETSDTGGFPWWGWLIIGLGVILAIVISVRVLGGSDDDGQASDAGAVPPPPPPPPPPPVTETPAEPADDAPSGATGDETPPSGATDPDTTHS